MTDQTLSGIRIAILATDGFEQSELTEPRSALDAIGADTVVISPKRDSVRGWKMKQWGDKVRWIKRFPTHIRTTMTLSCSLAA